MSSAQRSASATRARTTGQHSTLCYGVYSPASFLTHTSTLGLEVP